MNIKNLFNKIKWQYILIFILLIITIMFIYRNLCKKYCSCKIARNSNSNKEMFNSNENDKKYDLNGKLLNNSIREPDYKLRGEIVLYYASWCGYSRQFLPEWEKFVNYSKKRFPQLKVTTLRCESDNEEMCIQKGVEAYPTVILYPTDGAEIAFAKERTSEKLIEFVNENLNLDTNDSIN